MNPQKFNLLILEDNEIHFNTVEKYIQSNKEDDLFELYIYEKEASLSMVSNYTSYKTAHAHHIKSQKKNFERYFNPIINSFEDHTLICIIDINWGNNKGNGDTIKSRDDRYGLDFYREYLASSDKLKGVIITTVGSMQALKHELNGFNHVVAKKAADNGYLTDAVLKKYIEEIKKIANATIADEKKENTKIPVTNGISTDEANKI